MKLCMSLTNKASDFLLGLTMTNGVLPPPAPVGAGRSAVITWLLPPDHLMD